MLSKGVVEQRSKQGLSTKQWRTQGRFEMCVSYLEVLAHFDKLAVGVDVAHAGPLRELNLQADPRTHFILLNHLDMFDLL